MSTHYIGFYEALTKIIFELSSNIIKYAPYFFFCVIVVLGFYIPPTATLTSHQQLKSNGDGTLNPRLI